MMNTYASTADFDGMDETQRYFYVFVPARNNSSEALVDLTVTVTNPGNERVMGTADVDFISEKETRVIPVVIPIRASEFGPLGVIDVNVAVTDAEGNELNVHRHPAAAG